jgi:ABC-2 type transport system ATP-binding protein
MTTEAPNAAPHSASSPVIRATGLTKSYGRHKALDHVDLEIAAGRIIGLIGPNGAGKTTLMKAILGLANCDGQLEVLGLDPTNQRSQLMEDVCFIADVAVLPRWIRVNQLIELTGKIHPRFSKERCLAYLGKTKINQDSKVKTLSKGMVAQLHLALVMSIDARLLVLDEPTLGLDILYRKEFYSNLLNDYFDDERSIIITTHQVEEVEHILTDLIFINDGKISLHCSMEEVQQRYVEVMIKPDRAAAARALGPLHESQTFGRHIFLFDGVSREQLAEMGETRTPSVADLFVATMSPKPATTSGGQV